MLTLMMAFVSCQGQQAQKENGSMNDKKVLVAYFSWSGNTRAMAEHIAQKTGGDLFEIARKEPYSTDYNTCLEQAKSEKKENARPELSRRVENMAQYDVIFVGAPAWWYTAPMPIFTFLESYNFKGKTIIPFCTAWSDEVDTIKDMEAHNPEANHLKPLVLYIQSMSGKGFVGDKVTATDEWLKEIGF